MNRTVRYEIGLEDLNAMIAHECRGTAADPEPVEKRARRFLWLGMVIAIPVSGWFGWRLLEHATGRAEAGSAVVTWALLPALLLSWLLFDTVLQLEQVTARKKKWPAPPSPWEEGHRCGMHEVTLREDRLVEVTPWAEVSAAWELTRRVEESVTHLFVDRVGLGTLTIPKRGLGDGEAAFVEELKQRVGAAAAERVRRHVVERDSKCPACEYSLRGMAGVVCPECGLDLDVEALWWGESRNIDWS